MGYIIAFNILPFLTPATEHERSIQEQAGYTRRTFQTGGKAGLFIHVATLTD